MEAHNHGGNSIRLSSKVMTPITAGGHSVHECLDAGDKRRIAQPTSWRRLEPLTSSSTIRISVINRREIKLERAPLRGSTPWRGGCRGVLALRGSGQVPKIRRPISLSVRSSYHAPARRTLLGPNGLSPESPQIEFERTWSPPWRPQRNPGTALALELLCQARRVACPGHSELMEVAPRRAERRLSLNPLLQFDQAILRVGYRRG